MPFCYRVIFAYGHPYVALIVRYDDAAVALITALSVAACAAQPFLQVVVESYIGGRTPIEKYTPFQACMKQVDTTIRNANVLTLRVSDTSK